jgi:hypothetical protein
MAVCQRKEAIELVLTTCPGMLVYFYYVSLNWSTSHHQTPESGTGVFVKWLMLFVIIRPQNRGPVCLLDVWCIVVILSQKIIYLRRLFCLFVSAEMSHIAYHLMKKSVEQLGPKVIDVLSEPVGAFIAHQHRMFCSEQVDQTWERHFPGPLRATHVLDLGAGIARIPWLCVCATC